MSAMRSAVIAAGLVLLLAGCGGPSKAEQAKADACNAVRDIQAQVDIIKGLPIAAASIEPARSAAEAIRDDLATLDRVIPDLDTDQITERLTTAGATFRAALESAVITAFTTRDLNALSAIGPALQTGLDSLNTTFADVGC